ncbi:hypothetical protein P8C59_000870 [Phyllachora maydis]|uniref:Uncharacterized protein n=1 Tax=Phyllachora maydis TaxID=1825666 RepID=A0AAD9HYK1_9PEZI|nr:hypothetical protein P8C59_000870 [Phyllachora maydis]
MKTATLRPLRCIRLCRSIKLAISLYKLIMHLSLNLLFGAAALVGAGALCAARRFLWAARHRPSGIIALNHVGLVLGVETCDHARFHPAMPHRLPTLLCGLLWVAAFGLTSPTPVTTDSHASSKGAIVKGRSYYFKAKIPLNNDFIKKLNDIKFYKERGAAEEEMVQQAEYHYALVEVFLRSRASSQDLIKSIDYGYIGSLKAKTHGHQVQFLSDAMMSWLTPQSHHKCFAVDPAKYAKGGVYLDHVVLFESDLETYPNRENS